MEYTSTIESFSTHTEIKIEGTILLQNVLAIQQYLYLDPYHAATHRVLFDFRKTILEEGNSGATIMKMAMKSMQSRSFEIEAKIAFIGVTPKMKAFAQTFIEILQGSLMIFEYFEDYDDAVQWITT